MLNVNAGSGSEGAGGILTIILIVLIFGLLVLSHEWGHFMAARRSGIDVEEFGVGFPPRLYGIKRGKTLYSINLLPLGGFVRLKGETGTDSDPHSFASARFRVKAKVLLAGVLMNALMAYVFIFALCLTGLPPFMAGQENLGHPSYAQAKQLLVADVEGGSPAAKVGIKPNDYIQGFESEQALVDFTRAHAGQTISLTVKHGSQTRDISVRLLDPSVQHGFLGVVPVLIYKLRWGPLEAVWVAGWLTLKLLWLIVAGLAVLLWQIPALIVGLFHRGVPSAAAEASGPVGIFFILRSVQDLGLAYVALFVANVSAALAVFNALPIPALDGGRLAILGVQRAFGRRLGDQLETAIHIAGFVFLIGLAALITVYDFRKFL